MRMNYVVRLSLISKSSNRQLIGILEMKKKIMYIFTTLIYFQLIGLLCN